MAFQRTSTRTSKTQPFYTSVSGFTQQYSILFRTRPSSYTPNPILSSRNISLSLKLHFRLQELKRKVRLFIESMNQRSSRILLEGNFGDIHGIPENSNNPIKEVSLYIHLKVDSCMTKPLCFEVVLPLALLIQVSLQ